MGTSTLIDFRPYVYPEIPGVDIPTLDRNIKLTLIEFCEETWVLQKGVNFTIDVEDIDSEMSDSIIINLKGHFKYHRPFAIKQLRVDGTSWDLKYTEMINNSTYINSIRETGCKVFEIFDLYSIRIAPFESANEIYIQVVFKPLMDMTYVDDRLYYDWVEAIAAGAKWRLLNIPGKPWTNHQVAAGWGKVYRAYKSKARRKNIKQHSGMSQSVYPREFGF